MKLNDHNFVIEMFNLLPRSFKAKLLPICKTAALINTALRLTQTHKKLYCTYFKVL